MKIYEFPQGSEQWENARRGVATASQFKRIVKPSDGTLSTQHMGYIYELVRETIVDDPLHQFIGTKHTERGNELEPEAREFFIDKVCDAEQVGFIRRDDLAPLGCSPDGLIRNAKGDQFEAGLEIKCCGADKHIAILMGGGLPLEHKAQVHGSMAVTGLDKWYFMSYFPGLRPLILEVNRNSFTEKLSNQLDRFVSIYQATRDTVLKAITSTKIEIIKSN